MFIAKQMAWSAFLGESSWGDHGIYFETSHVTIYCPQARFKRRARHWPEQCQRGEAMKISKNGDFSPATWSKMVMNHHLNGDCYISSHISTYPTYLHIIYPHMNQPSLRWYMWLVFKDRADPSFEQISPNDGHSRDPWHNLTLGKAWSP